MEIIHNQVQNDQENTSVGAKDFTDMTHQGISEVATAFSRGSNGVTAGENGEGTLTKQIESLTSKIPSATFLSLAVGSVGLALLLRLAGNRDDAQFVGHWVPTILLLGLYNKIVKLQGSE